MNEKKQKRNESALVKHSGTATQMVATVVGELLAQHPNTAVAGIAVKTAAPVAGSVVQRGVNRVQQVVERIGLLKWLRGERGLTSAAQRIEEEGLKPNPEVMADVLVAAFEIMGDAETEEKRRLIENLIVNAARRSDDAARTEALTALHYIRKMPSSAAGLFGCVVADLEQMAGPNTDLREYVSEVRPRVAVPYASRSSANAYHGLTKIVVMDGVDYLTVTAGGQLLSRSSQTVDGSEQWYVHLNERGVWLADWIKRNPSPKEKQDQTAGEGKKSA